jgi:alcohol dehydrogenase
MSSKIKTFHYQIPTKIVFGVDTIKQLPEIAQSFSKKVFVMSMKDIPGIPKILESLKDNGFDVTDFYDISPNPFTTEAENAANLAKEHNCKLIIAIGGGSVIDTAKAVSIAMTNPGEIWEYTIEMGDKMRRVVNTPIPIIAVPTTAGTGAEVSQNAILTHPVTKTKGPIRSVESCPKFAIIDPRLLLSMPERLTIATGFDAFTHAFEKFLGQEYFPYIDAIALDAMKTVVDNLELTVQHPDDLESHSNMGWASAQAALCVLAESFESGLHVFSLPLSGLFQVPHGEALAIVMPFVIRELTKIRPDRVSRLLDVFAPLEKTMNLGEEDRCNLCIQEMEKWLKRLGLNKKISDYGVKKEDIPKLAETTNKKRIEDAWERTITQKDVEAYFLMNL